MFCNAPQIIIIQIIFLLIDASTHTHTRRAQKMMEQWKAGWQEERKRKKKNEETNTTSRHYMIDKHDKNL
jgi:hypothetical protein